MSTSEPSSIVAECQPGGSGGGRPGGGGATTAVDESAVKGVACAFRNHETLGAALLAAALDDDPSNDHAEALGLSDTCWFRVRGLLLK